MKIFAGLKELLLEDNLLTCLPENLDLLENLKVLTLMSNPMEDPPIRVCAQGNDAIWKYLKENRIKKQMTIKVYSAQTLSFSFKNFYSRTTICMYTMHLMILAFHSPHPAHRRFPACPRPTFMSLLFKPDPFNNSPRSVNAACMPMDGGGADPGAWETCQKPHPLDN